MVFMINFWHRLGLTGGVDHLEPSPTFTVVGFTRLDSRSPGLSVLQFWARQD